MEFRLQASNPRTLLATNPDDTKIDEAMETVFPMLAEDAIMVWAGVHIPLDYKYVISWMFSDILIMLGKLLTETTGQWCNRWPVQEFEVTWKMAWDGDRLEIHSEWQSTPNFTESILAGRPSTIVVNKSDFVAEWKQPLCIIEQAIRKAGYDESQLVDLSELRRMIDAIPRSGILYRDS